MEIKSFLTFISQYTLVNFSLLKRLHPATPLKVLREHIKTVISDGLVLVHDYSDLRCFSLSASGFKALNIQHQPKLHFSQTQADQVCRVNHIRLGFEQSLDKQQDTALDRWVSGSKFHKSPFHIHIKNTDQPLMPAGAAIVRDTLENQKVFFIHHFSDLESLNHDLTLYQQLEAKRYHQKRFFLNDKASIRIIVLLPNDKAFYVNKPYFQHPLYQSTLFLSLGHCHHENLLHQPVFIDIHGTKRSIIIQSP
jgi:hypothetical protein